MNANYIFIKFNSFFPGRSKTIHILYYVDDIFSNKTIYIVELKYPKIVEDSKLLARNISYK